MFDSFQKPLGGVWCYQCVLIGATVILITHTCMFCVSFRSNNCKKHISLEFHLGTSFQQQQKELDSKKRNISLPRSRTGKVSPKDQFSSQKYRSLVDKSISSVEEVVTPCAFVDLLSFNRIILDWIQMDTQHTQMS